LRLKLKAESLKLKANVRIIELINLFKYG
jgi:hypothetical protein